MVVNTTHLINCRSRSNIARFLIEFICTKIYMVHITTTIITIIDLIYCISAAVATAAEGRCYCGCGCSTVVSLLLGHHN